MKTISKSPKIISIFLISIISKYNIYCEVLCTAEEALKATDCEIITTTVTIEKNFPFLNTDTWRQIKRGLVIKEIDVSVVNGLKSVEKIENIDGPGIKFENNKKLRSVNFRNLRSLNGSPPVIFINDNLIKSSFFNDEAMKTFLQLEFASRAFPDICRYNFAEIYRFSYGENEKLTKFYILLIFTVVGLILNIGLFAFLTRDKWLKFLNTKNELEPNLEEKPPQINNKQGGTLI